MCRRAGAWWRVRFRRRAGNGSAGCAGFGRHGKRGGCGAASVSAEGVAVGGVCAGWGGAGLVRGAPQVTGPIDLLWYTGRALGAPAPEGTIHLVCPQKMRPRRDRKSTRLNSSHLGISYAVFCLKTTKKTPTLPSSNTRPHCQEADGMLLSER